MKVRDLNSVWEASLNEKEPAPHPCFCVGPQNGEPLCPCGMRSKHAEEHKMLAKIMGKYTLVPKK